MYNKILSKKSCKTFCPYFNLFSIIIYYIFTTIFITTTKIIVIIYAKKDKLEKQFKCVVVL
jgi:hypothetical protein